MIQNKLPPLILILRELKTSLYNFLASLQLSISPNEGILSLANRVIELINKEDIVNNLNNKDLITYQILINDLNNKKNNLIDILSNESIVVNQDSDLSTLINHCLQIIPQKNTYFITSKKDLILNLRGNGYVYFKDNNRNIIKEVMLKDNDITEIKIEGLTKEKNTIFLENLEHITELDVHGNKIEEINFGINSTITTLKLYENHIQDLDITNLLSLQYFHIYNNPIVVNCLTTGFKEERDELDFPVVDINSESYQKLSNLLNNLPNRKDQALGSIILYPWDNQLETLIYEADGYHYRTPYLEFENENGEKYTRTGYDFNDIVNGIPCFITSLNKNIKTSASFLEKGTYCKYPRRLRFISPKQTATNYTYKYKTETKQENGTTKTTYNYEFDINDNTHRIKSGKWYTDQPLSDVIYNSEDQEDTTRSLNHVIDGIEFKDENSNESILYAMVKGYDINDPTKHYNKDREQRLYYCTFNKNLNIIEHPLTKYNELRKSLEKEISQKDSINFKNWFFGSAIQNTEDFEYLNYEAKFHGVHHVWETTQKGFGRVFGIADVMAGIQPDWNKKNVIRFTHMFGNVADAFSNLSKKQEINTSYYDKIYASDFRAGSIFNKETDTSSIYSGMRYNSIDGWTGNKDAEFGHGDLIISAIDSIGQNRHQYKNDENENIEINFILYGMCPNACIYAFDIWGRLSFRIQRFIEHNGIIKQLYKNDNPTSSSYSDGKKYLVHNSNNEIYKWNSINKIYEKTGEIIEINNDNSFYATVESFSSTFFNLSLKELCEDSDLGSFSVNMSSFNNYTHYLIGRFGERRYIGQSSGNSGDNCDATTDHETRGDCFKSYKTFNTLNSSDVNDVYYHPTFYQTAALAPGGHSLAFSNASTAIKTLKSGFQDYNIGIGRNLDYRIYHGIPCYASGTSMSCPTVVGVTLLMMNLYKVIHPDYPEEPPYENNDNSLTKNLLYNENNLLDGGFGKFSVFMDYVKNNWYSRPKTLMTNQQGIGYPNFITEPSIPIINNVREFNTNSKYYNKQNNQWTIPVGEAVNLFNGDINYHIINHMQKAAFNKKEPQNSKIPLNFHFASINYNREGKFLDQSLIMPIVLTNENGENIVLCDNLSAYDNFYPEFDATIDNSNRPANFTTYYNTYNYYPITIKSTNKILQLLNKDYITDFQIENDCITIPKKIKKFSIQMKIDSSSQNISEEEINSGNFNSRIVLFKHEIKDKTSFEFYFNKVGVDDKNDIIYTQNSGFQIDYTAIRSFFKRILNVNKIKIKPIQNQKFNVGGQILLRAMGLYMKDKDYNENNSYIFSFTFNNDECKVYINGNYIASCETMNAQLDKIIFAISSFNNYLDNKELLIYDRELTDYEVAYNSAYMLQKEN